MMGQIAIEKIKRIYQKTSAGMGGCVAIKLPNLRIRRAFLFQGFLFHSLLLGLLLLPGGLSANDSALEHLSDEALLERAIRVYRLENDCMEATRLYFELLGREPTPHLQVAALFNMGVCYERRGLWQEALDNYQVILREFPQVPEAADARFREGVVLEQLGRYRDAEKAFATISPTHPGVSTVDLRAIQVQRAWQEVMLGHDRTALRLLEPVLDAWAQMPEEERKPERFFYGKARVALGILLLGYASARPVGPKGPLEFLGISLARLQGAEHEDTWLRRRLSEREERILAARVHLEAASDTRDPIWISACHYLEGQAAEAYVDALGRSPIPSYLKGEARDTYQEALQQQLRRTKITASELYLRGHELAVGNVDSSEWARQLKRKAEVIEQKGVDALGHPDVSPVWKGNVGGNRAELTF